VVLESVDSIYFLLFFFFFFLLLFSNDQDGYSGMSLDGFYLVWLVCVI
jgi:hypothetical protein